MKILDEKNIIESDNKPLKINETYIKDDDNTKNAQEFDENAS